MDERKFTLIENKEKIADKPKKSLQTNPILGRFLNFSNQKEKGFKVTDLFKK